MKLREIEFVLTDRENSWEVYVGDFRVGYFTYMPMLDSYMFNPSFGDFFDLQRASYKSKDEFSSTLSEYVINKYYKLDLFRNRLFDDKKEVFFQEIVVEEITGSYITFKDYVKYKPFQTVAKNVTIEKENGAISVHCEEMFQSCTIGDTILFKVLNYFIADDLDDRYEYDKNLIYHKSFDKFLNKITFGLIKLTKYLPKEAIVKEIWHKNMVFTPKFLTINGETF